MSIQQIIPEEEINDEDAYDPEEPIVPIEMGLDMEDAELAMEEEPGLEAAAEQEMDYNETDESDEDAGGDGSNGGNGGDGHNDEDAYDPGEPIVPIEMGLDMEDAELVMEEEPCLEAAAEQEMVYNETDESGEDAGGDEGNGGDGNNGGDGSNGGEILETYNIEFKMSNNIQLPFNLGLTVNCPLHQGPCVYEIRLENVPVRGQHLFDVYLSENNGQQEQHGIPEGNRQ